MIVTLSLHCFIPMSADDVWSELESANKEYAESYKAQSRKSSTVGVGRSFKNSFIPHVTHNDHQGAQAVSSDTHPGNNLEQFGIELPHQLQTATAANLTMNSNQDLDLASPLLSPAPSQAPGPLPPSSYVALPDPLPSKLTADGWASVGNLDKFFTNLYSHYHSRGTNNIVSKGITEIVSLLLTLIISIVALFYIDWGLLSECSDENSCHPNLSAYVYFSSPPPLTFFLVSLYITIFLLYTLLRLLQIYHTITESFKTSRFFEEALKISRRHLEMGAVSWDDVVSKVIALQTSGDYRVSISGHPLTHLNVSMRVMRKENYLVALFNERSCLDLRAPNPLPFLRDAAERFLSLGDRNHQARNSLHRYELSNADHFSKSHYLSKSLEWSLYLTILNHMFTPSFTLRPSFYSDPKALKRRFILTGIVMLIFLPFLLLFIISYFFLNNSYSFKRQQKYLGPRQWSPLGHWKFREYNEMQHFYDRRISQSYTHADNYLKTFCADPMTTGVCRVVSFLSGSLVAVLLLFAAVNESILLYVKYGSQNLLWYVGVFGGIFAVSKGMLPDETMYQSYSSINFDEEAEMHMMKVASFTHYLPMHWRGRAWNKNVRAEFSSLFLFKAQGFVLEVLSVVFAPAVLMFTLPKCAEKICWFIKEVTVNVDGVGDVCGFSTFDFEKFKMREMELEDIEEGNPVQHVCDWNGKMEKSFLAFKSAHPEWKCAKSGEEFIDKLDRWNKEQEEKLRIERENFILRARREADRWAEKGTDADEVPETATHPVSQGLASPMGSAPGLGLPPLPLSRHSTLGSVDVPNAFPSVLHYNDAALSTELRALLNQQSSFLPGNTGLLHRGLSISAISRGNSDGSGVASGPTSPSRVEVDAGDARFVLLHQYHENNTSK